MQHNGMSKIKINYLPSIILPIWVLKIRVSIVLFAVTSQSAGRLGMLWIVHNCFIILQKCYCSYSFKENARKRRVVISPFNSELVRRVWLSKSLRKDTKIRIFNACVKSVHLYECETWLVTKEIHRKMQTFVNNV